MGAAVGAAVAIVLAERLLVVVSAGEVAGVTGAPVDSLIGVSDAAGLAACCAGGEGVSGSGVTSCRVVVEVFAILSPAWRCCEKKAPIAKPPTRTITIASGKTSDRGFCGRRGCPARRRRRGASLTRLRYHSSATFSTGSAGSSSMCAKKTSRDPPQSTA